MDSDRRYQRPACQAGETGGSVSRYPFGAYKQRDSCPAYSLEGAGRDIPQGL